MFFLNSILIAHINVDSLLVYFLSIPVLALVLVFLTKIILMNLAPKKFEINTFLRYFLVWTLYLLLILGIAFIILERM